MKKLTIDDLNILLDCIIDTSKTFLQKDIKIEIETIGVCQDNYAEKYSAWVSFKGDLEFFYFIAIDEKLLKNIFKVMVPFEVDEKEQEEMVNQLSDEVLNTVAGFAISKFPNKYNDLTMSVPLIVDKKTLKQLDTTLSVSKKIQTIFGAFTCTVFTK